MCRIKFALDGIVARQIAECLLRQCAERHLPIGRALLLIVRHIRPVLHDDLMLQLIHLLRDGRRTIFPELVLCIEVVAHGTPVLDEIIQGIGNVLTIDVGLCDDLVQIQLAVLLEDIRELDIVEDIRHGLLGPVFEGTALDIVRLRHILECITARCTEGEDADAHKHHQDGDGVHDRADYFFGHYFSPSCFSIL